MSSSTVKGMNILGMEILKSINEMILIVDEHGIISYCNKKAEDYFVLNSKDIIGKYLFEIVTYKDFGTIKKEIFSKLIEGKSWMGDLTVINTDSNKEFPLYSCIFPLYDKEKYVGSISISKLHGKLHEDFIDASQGNRAIRSLLNNTFDVLFVFDEVGRILFVNSATETIFGYRINEMIGHSFAEFFEFDQLAVVSNKFAEKMTGEREISEPYEIKFVHKNGKVDWLEVKSWLIQNEMGGRNIVGAARVITEKKLAVKKLELSERRLETIIETANDGILTVNLRHYLVYVNSSTLQMFGFEREEVLGKRVTDFIPKEEHLIYFDHLKNALSKKDNQRAVYRLNGLKKDGSTFPFEFTVSIIPEGKDESITIVLRDVTAQMEAEEEKNSYIKELARKQAEIESIAEKLKITNAELLESRNQLTEINEGKDKFFSIIAHDLKGPFSGLISMSEFLRDEAHNSTREEIQELSNTILSSAKLVYNLLNNLLQWSRVQMGRVTPHRDKLLIDELLHEVETLYLQSATEKNIEIMVVNYSEAFVFADKQMILTVLRNLVSNAIKFTPNGGKVILGARLNYDSVEITVQDSGIGMPQKLIDNLYRIDKKVTRVGTAHEQGTGMGLIMAKEFIKKNGGSISLHSQEGVGSTFTVLLPLPTKIE